MPKDVAIVVNGDLVVAKPRNRLADVLDVLSGAGDYQITLPRNAESRRECGAQEGFGRSREQSIVGIDLPVMDATDARLNKVLVRESSSTGEGPDFT